MKKLVVYFFLVFLIHGLPSTLYAAITAKVEPASVNEGELFRLIITNNSEQMADGLPDLTALEQQFEVVSTEHSTQYIVVNGQAQTSSQWVIVLRAYATGVLTIPSLSIGKDVSPATTVEVLPLTAHKKSDKIAQPTAENGVKFITELSDPSPYIGQQVIYTVKLYSSSHLLDARFQPPTVENALFVPLGEATQSQMIENDRHYIIEEQRYAIFPQKSGPLKINPPTLEALTYEAVPRRIRLKAKSHILQVKPIPSRFNTKDWLPAEQVTLSEQYNKKDSTIDEGGTIERVITLTAKAAPAQLLPNLTFHSNKNYNVYPEKPSFNNQITAETLVGKTTFKVTYVFNKAGIVTVPKLKLPWFNTITGKEEVATLPAKTITILPKDKSHLTSHQPLKQMNTTKHSMPLMQVKKEDISWFKWLALVFAFLWLATVGLWWCSRHTSFFIKHHALRQLKKACFNSEPLGASRALLAWAQYHFKNEKILTLHQIASYLKDPLFKKQILQLSSVLYSKQEPQQQWEGRALWESMQRWCRRKRKPQHQRKQPLPPINP